MYVCDQYGSVGGCLHETPVLCWRHMLCDQNVFSHICGWYKGMSPIFLLKVRNTFPNKVVIFR
jgi:hypothetical protein